jgi:signal transduction histidine kinase
LTQIDSELSRRRAQPLRAVGSSATRIGTKNAHRGLVRMALDLHDGPLQDLTAVGFATARLQNRLQEIEATTSRAIEDLLDLQRQLVAVEAALRSVATNDDPAVENATVIELIDKETVAFKARCDASVEIRVVGDVEAETASQRIAIHRVLRECLSNVARHSGADNVRIDVVGKGDAIELSVTDDGVGFDPDGARPDDERVRLGLSGMEHRLELLDGTLLVDSRLGGPTTITATIQRWRPETGPRPAA